MAVIEGIRVTIYKKIGVGDEAEYSYVGSDLTDENGDFSLASLPEGTYRLKFSDPAGAYITEYYNSKESLETANDIAVSAATTNASNDAILTTSSYVTGNVTDS